MNPTTTNTCVSRFTFLVCGVREGFKTTWNHLHMLFSTVIACLRALYIACISFHHMVHNHVWKPHLVIHLTTFNEREKSYDCRLLWCAISLTLMFMVLMAKHMAQFGAFHFILSSSIAKCLPWVFQCTENELSLHDKCSARLIQYEHSTCTTSAYKHLTFHGKEIDSCSKQCSLNFWLHLLISMLLITSGDVERNPGPKQGIP